MNRLRVLAAMSGGVDSAVAAARAADAGHDVTGVQCCRAVLQPQSYRSGARGCCRWRTPATPAGRRGRDRHPVLRVGHGRAVATGTWWRTSWPAEYAAGRTPNPCLRCNEKIKFAAVLDGPSRSGSTRSAPAITPGSVTAAWSAAWTRARTSPTCWPCSTASSSAGPCSRWAPRPRPRYGRKRRRGGWPWPPSRTATTSASSRTGTPGRSWPAAGRRAGPDRGPGRDAGRHARRRLRLHHRPAQGAAGRGPGRGRPAPLCAGHRASDPDRDRRAARVPGRAGDPGRAAGVERQRAASRAAGVPGAAAGARRGAPGQRRAGEGDTVRITLDPQARGVAKGQAAVLYDGDAVTWAAAPSARPGPWALRLLQGGIRPLTSARRRLCVCSPRLLRIPSAHHVNLASQT